MASALAPVLRFYQVLLWPVAWPSGQLLDAWIGPEGVSWFREGEVRQVLQQHAREQDTEIGAVEATGAINFLVLDDLPVGVRDLRCPLGQVLHRLTVRPKQPDSDVIDKDLILVWTDEQRRIITGSDLLGRLLRSIARSERPDAAGTDARSMGQE